MSAEASNDDTLNSPQRLLIELRLAHAELDGLIDSAGLPAQAQAETEADDLTLRRLKKRRLLLRDQIARLVAELDPPEPA